MFDPRIEIEVVEADKYVKNVFPLAEWMREDRIGHVCAFIPAPKDKIGKFQYGVSYEINGKVYFPMWTNKHDELVRFYEEEKDKPKQMSLADYGIE